MVRPYLSQDQLAAILCVSKKTLQNRLSANPSTLPQPIKFPGAKSPVWDPVTVEAWQNAISPSGSSEARVSQDIIVSTMQEEPAPKKKRGRPSNLARFGGAAHA